MLWCYKSYTNLGRTLVYRITGILSSPPSERYDIAQHTSIRISSTSFSIRTFASEGIALLTFSKLGAGLPLHKFERVQLAFLTNDDPGCALSKISAIGFMAPALITRSLTLKLSPAIFPNPQMACSTTSIWGEFRRSTKTLIVPFSIKTYTWSDYPLARFVRHQAASNYKYYILCKILLEA